MPRHPQSPFWSLSRNQVRHFANANMRQCALPLVGFWTRMKKMIYSCRLVTLSGLAIFSPDAKLASVLALRAQGNKTGEMASIPYHLVIHRSTMGRQCQFLMIIVQPCSVKNMSGMIAVFNTRADIPVTRSNCRRCQRATKRIRCQILEDNCGSN